MGKTLTKKEILSKLGYENKGRIYYKTVKNRKSFIQPEESAFFEVVYEPRFSEQMYNGKKIKNYYMSVCPAYPNWDTKEFEVGDQISVTISETDYNFITNYLEPKQGMIISARFHGYKNKMGFQVEGRKWAEVIPNKYFGAGEIKTGGDQEVKSGDDEF